MNELFGMPMDTVVVVLAVAIAAVGGAVGLLAAFEQHLAAVDVTGLGPDRQNAQRLAT